MICFFHHLHRHHHPQRRFDQRFYSTRFLTKPVLSYSPVPLFRCCCSAVSPSVAKKRLVSGVQPTGSIHLGNYLGAIKNWVALQDTYETLFFIVDLHATTLPYDTQQLAKATIDTAALYLACGIDISKATVFVQSHVRAHVDLMWLLCSSTPIGWLQKMTQFKEKSRKEAKLGRDKECRAALQHIRGHDIDISHEANTIRDTMEMGKQSGGARIMELFQKRYIYPLIIGVGLMLLQQLSGSSGVIYYASSLYERGGFPSAIGTSIMATIMIPKAMIGTIIVDKMGRRTLLMASCAGMGLFALLLCTSYTFQSMGILPELTPIFTCISVLGYIISYALGMGGLPWIIMSEIFPMNVKVSAGTLVTVTNWACGWVITFTFNLLMQWNAAGTFFIFSTVSAISIMFIYFLVPETKGRSLEEIQTLLSNSVH